MPEQMTPVRMRRLPLAGTKNTRDLGGFPCEGGVTKWGVFLRSDSPHELTEADVALLHRYGVRHAVDLRSEHERVANPSVLAGVPGIESHQVPLADHLITADYEGDLPGSMAGYYISALDVFIKEFGDIVRVLALAEGGALFHCAVGKDRTGMVSMLLLALAGVADEDIVADYASTDIYMREIFDMHVREMKKRTSEYPEYVLRSLPKSMWRVLGHLQDVHGGPESYLLSAGLSAGEIQALCKKFVQPI